MPTWTNLTAFPLYLYGMLAWILVGTCDAPAFLKAVPAGAQNALQDLPKRWVPHVTMRIGLATVHTSLDKVRNPTLL